MISHGDIERYLDDWLGNVPMDPADRVVVSVAVRIQRERQRRAPLLQWGRAEASTLTKLAAGVAAVVLGAVIGLSIARPGPGPGATLPTPSPTAEPSPSASPTAAPSPTPRSITASLEGGLPSSWTVTATGLLSFSVDADGASMTVEALRDSRVMDEGCAYEPEAGVGSTADAFIGTIADRRGLVASGLGPVEVGGLPGRQVDLRLDTTVGATCPGEDEPFVPLFGSYNADFWGFAGLTPNERIRLIAVDIPGGDSIVVYIVASDVASFDRFIDDAMTIVGNLSFEIGS